MFKNNNLKTMFELKKVGFLTAFVLAICLLNIPSQVLAITSAPIIDPDTKEKSIVEIGDTTAPVGYTVSFGNHDITSTNATNVSFTIHNAEIGTQLYYWIYDGTVISQEGDREPSNEMRNFPTPVMITSTEQTVSGLDLSEYDLGQIVLVATLVDDSMNFGIDAYDYAIKLDTVSPIGYSVSFDNNDVNPSNQSNVSFTIHNAEIGTQLYYWIYDGTVIPQEGDREPSHEMRNYPTPVMITSTEQTVSGLDLSNYDLGQIVLVATLVDDSMNFGIDAYDYAVKSVPENPPSNGGGGGGIILQFLGQGVTPQVLGEKITGEGTWIKTNDSSTVYFLDTNNIRHAYPNEGIWYSYFGKDFSFVETISKDELATYPLGKNVQYKPGTLMKIPSIPKVYLVGENFNIQWIKSESTAIRLYGVNWAKQVKDLNEAFFSDYVIGADIE